MRKPTTLIYVVFIVIISISITQAQRTGDQLFNTFCNVCHTVNKGKLIGPDLADVQIRRSEAWLLEYIKSSQSMINKGDPDAVAIYKEYNQVIMPDAPYSQDEIKLILGYIASKSPSYVAKVEALPGDTTITEPEEPVRSVEDATEEEIGIGRMLFAGEMRLEGHGPSCISCHNVKNDKLIGGGLLAKDLTDVFSRMNEAGIKAIVGTSPFPAMNEAYTGATITDDEAFYLTAFLKEADEQQYGQHDRDYQQYFLIAGVFSLATLLFIFSMIWSHRKKESVNQKIFSRQLRSETSYYS